ncbi:hypothetical protein HBI56_146050 [Parastagonospora nodorum]|nr:hypothetical protein HBI10_166910 [Parastagonospora nodorum]KAH4015640.1 hypothetical protein HBI13_156500 [Parastagonospora nodorum]KAH4173578.1 hypothetical protein HBH43_079600 [Parastagonospora nodorum]KAH4181987.1 hypothetical protein HBH42_226760 [Parastagonospora nodorum]KAH4228177.1 hypothetical protein HBI06_102160 [Parastagonospora nodorum]
MVTARIRIRKSMVLKMVRRALQRSFCGKHTRYTRTAAPAHRSIVQGTLLYDTYQSHCSTRGWTFQEAALNRRRLVFTEDQLYFECRTMNCSESAHYPLGQMHVESKAETFN